MELTEIGALQIAKKVDAILHVPGNYRGGNLEMAIVSGTEFLLRNMGTDRTEENGFKNA